MKRLFITLLCLVLAVSFSFAGCGMSETTKPNTDTNATVQEKPTETKENKPTTISFWDTANDSDPNDIKYAWIKKNIEEFEKANTNVKVEITVVSNADQYLNKITTEMAANNVPDVFMTWVAGRLEPFVTAGRLAPLNDIIEGDAEFKSVLNMANLTSATFDGKIYAIPNELAGEAVFINKSLFEKHNVTIPTNWNELMTAVKVFTDNDIIPFALANKDPWLGTIPYMMIFDRLNGPEKYKEVMFDKQLKFTDDAYANAARKLLELKEAGAYPDNFNSLGYDEGETLFKTEKAAMIINGSWGLPDYLKTMGDKVDFINFPDIDGGTGKAAEDWLTIQNNAYALGSSSKNPEAAASFLKFMFSKTRQAELANTGYMIATVNIPVDEAKLSPVALKLNKSLANAKNSILIWDVMLGQNIGKELNLATQSILAGAPIEETFDKLNKIAAAEWK